MRLARPSTLLPRHAPSLCAAVSLATAALGGCGAPAPSETAEGECAPGTVPQPDGICRPAGLPPAFGACAPGTWSFEGGPCEPAGLPAIVGPCAPGSTLDAGECVPAGIPPDACAEGFLAAGGDGCVAILPDAPCPEGQLALPGETVCHEVAPCGQAPFGQAPLEATTQYVDIAYPGGDSDGTAGKPWTTVQQAVDAAASGAVVAIAAGQYAEDVVIEDKPVRLWGRCPAMVTIAGAANAVTVEDGGGGTEIHDIGFTSGGIGVRVQGAEGVSLSRVWVHDTLTEGIHVKSYLAKPSTDILIEDSLVEGAGYRGIAVVDSQASIHRCAVRKTVVVPGFKGAFGMMAFSSPGSDVAEVTITSSIAEDNPNGIDVLAAEATITGTLARGSDWGILALNGGERRSQVTIAQSVVEGSALSGIYVEGSDATIDATAVRDDASGKGYGLWLARHGESGERAVASVLRSVVTNNHGYGVLVEGAEANVTATLIHATQMTDGLGGVGVAVCGGDAFVDRGVLHMIDSTVSDNHLTGISIIGSDATIEGTRVTGTQGVPEGGGDILGRGIEASADAAAVERSVVGIERSYVADNHDAGILVAGSDCTIASTEVKGTLPPSADPTTGRGLQVQPDRHSGARAMVTVRASLVADNQDVGVFVIGSDALLEGVRIQGTKPPEGAPLFGSGVNSELDVARGLRAVLTLRGCEIAENRGSGLLVRGADAFVDTTLIRDTLPELPTGRWGRGIMATAEKTTKSRAYLDLRASRVAGNTGFGIGVHGSDALIEGTEVTGTLPNPADGWDGHGVQIWNHEDTGNRSIVTLTDSLIASNHTTGVRIGGADVQILGVKVSDTNPDDEGLYGRGIGVQPDLAEGVRATVLVRDCHLANNHDMGVIVNGSDGTIDHTLVESTLARPGDGLFGDAVVAVAYAGRTALTVRRSLLADSARAGLSSFGSDVSLESTRIVCSAFDLESEKFEGGKASFEDLGDNLCGCPEPVSACHAVSVGLEPPDRNDLTEVEVAIEKGVLDD